MESHGEVGGYSCAGARRRTASTMMRAQRSLEVMLVPTTTSEPLNTAYSARSCDNLLSESPMEVV